MSLSKSRFSNTQHGGVVPPVAGAPTESDSDINPVFSESDSSIRRGEEHDYVGFRTQQDVADDPDVDATQQTVANWIDTKFGKDSDFCTDPDWLKVDNVWRFQRPDPSARRCGST